MYIVWIREHFPFSQPHLSSSFLPLPEEEGSDCPVPPLRHIMLSLLHLDSRCGGRKDVRQQRRRDLRTDAQFRNAYSIARAKHSLICSGGS